MYSEFVLIDSSICAREPPCGFESQNVTRLFAASYASPPCVHAQLQGGVGPMHYRPAQHHEVRSRGDPDNKLRYKYMDANTNYTWWTRYEDI